MADRRGNRAQANVGPGALPDSVTELPARERDLPHGIGELQEKWKELPATITPEQLLRANWLGGLTRAPMYRALARGDLPVVKLGRRTLVLTVPLLKLLGLDLAERP